jgi:hypothetical protein
MFLELREASPLCKKRIIGSNSYLYCLAIQITYGKKYGRFIFRYI